MRSVFVGARCILPLVLACIGVSQPAFAQLDREYQVQKQQGEQQRASRDQQCIALVQRSDRFYVWGSNMAWARTDAGGRRVIQAIQLSPFPFERPEPGSNDRWRIRQSGFDCLIKEPPQVLNETRSYAATGSRPAAQRLIKEEGCQFVVYAKALGKVNRIAVGEVSLSTTDGWATISECTP